MFPVKSAKRVLELFEFFAERQAPATAGEVASALSFPQSSTSMLLRSLVSLRYLDYDYRTRTFYPTLRILILGAWVQERVLGELNLLQFMEDLSKEIGETVLLSMQNGIHALYIHIVEGGEPLHFSIRTYALRPLARTTIGKALLLSKPNEEVRALLMRINAEEEDPTNKVSIPALIEELAEHRKQGFVYTERSRLIEGVGVVAMTLPSLIVQTPLVLSAAGPFERIGSKKDRITQHMRKAIEAMTLLSEAANT
ncbi:MAG: helix-turn-helix domain-containing protein [Pseudaminobacter sp.]